ncbi:unnamed protein product, partial [Callosobruchus maculatus]
RSDSDILPTLSLVSVFHKCLRSDSDITNADERFDVIIAVCQSDNLLKFF